MLKIGMVGVGFIAGQHATCLAQIPDAQVAGMFDVAGNRAEEMAKRFSATAYTNLASMLEDVDIVYICTPPKFHREAVISAVEAGVHIFCEKPLAASIDDVTAIQHAVENSRIIFTMGFHVRFVSANQQLKALVREGKLGEIYSFWRIRNGFSPWPAPNWRTDPRFLCGMTIESLSHEFDLARWIAGDIVSACGRVGTSRPDLKGYDNIISATMTLKNGGMAHIHATWASHVHSDQCGIVGSLGSAVREKGVVRWRSEEMDEESIIESSQTADSDSPYLRESEQFIDCIQNDKNPLTSVADGVATVKISHAVLESSKTGCTVVID